MCVRCVCACVYAGSPSVRPLNCSTLLRPSPETKRNASQPRRPDAQSSDGSTLDALSACALHPHAHCTHSTQHSAFSHACPAHTLRVPCATDPPSCREPFIAPWPFLLLLRQCAPLNGKLPLNRSGAQPTHQHRFSSSAPAALRVYVCYLSLGGSRQDQQVNL